MDTPPSLQIFDDSLRAFQDYSSKKSTDVVKKELPSAVNELELRLDQIRDPNARKSLDYFLHIARGAELNNDELFEWNRNVQSLISRDATTSYWFRRHMKKYFRDPEDMHKLIQKNKVEGVQTMEHMLNGMLNDVYELVQARYNAGRNVEVDRRNLAQIVLLRKYILPTLSQRSKIQMWGKGKPWIVTAISLLAAAAVFKYTGVPLPIIPAALIDPDKIPRATKILFIFTLVMLLLYLITCGNFAVGFIGLAFSAVFWLIYAKMFHDSPPRIEESPGPGVVYGKVVNARGVGIRDVQITHRASTESEDDAILGDTTDHTGRFSFELDTGNYTLTAQCDEYRNETKDNKEISPGENEFNFRLTSV